MSLVVAMRDDNGVVHMASDSMASTHFTKADFDTCKITPTLDGDLIIGFVGSMHLSELQYYHYLPSAMGPSGDESMTKKLEELDKIYKEQLEDIDFITDVKYEIMKRVKKITGTPEGKQVSLGGNILIAFKDKMYLMWDDFAMVPIDNDWAAIGSGEYHATSVMKIFEGYEGSDVIDILATAIKIAGDSVLSVGGKIYYTNTEDCEVVEISLEEIDREEEQKIKEEVKKESDNE